MVQLAEWDTKNFGIKVGNLLWNGDVDLKVLEEEIEHSRAEGYRLLYLKDVELPTSALNERIVLADEKVVYAMTLHDRLQTVDDGHVVSMLHCDLSQELLELSYESGRYSRYHTDKRFPTTVFKTLYSLWIKNSLNGLIATDVLAYIQGNVPIGIITYQQTPEKVVIGLVAVNRMFANQGIGTRLMQAFLSKFEIGTNIEVATQRCNSMACHFYEKNGFTVKSVTNIYHIWNQ